MIIVRVSIGNGQFSAGDLERRRAGHGLGRRDHFSGPWYLNVNFPIVTRSPSLRIGFFELLGR